MVTTVAPACTFGGGVGSFDAMEVGRSAVVVADTTTLGSTANGRDGAAETLGGTAPTGVRRGTVLADARPDPTVGAGPTL